MTDSDRQRKTLLVSDLPGHILHRIAESWERNLPDPHGHFSCHTHDPHDLRMVSAGYDVVHWIDNLHFMAVADSLGVPQVVMVHHLTQSEYPAFNRSIKNADAITTGCWHWKRKLEGEFQRQVHLIPYTVDSRHFPFSVKHPTSRKDSKEPFRLGFVCKATSDHDGRKGIGLFLKIVADLNQIIPNLEVILVGRGWNENQASLNATGALVHRYECGRTEATKYLYALMDAMIVTSSEEGGPCNILEAMATGVPVVTSVVGHVPELIKDGETGFLCQNRTVEEYIAKVMALYEIPGLGQQVARQAREVIEKEREESIAIPRIDFNGIYDEAIARFGERPSSELRLRRLQGYYRSLRHYAKRIFR